MRLRNFITSPPGKTLVVLLMVLALLSAPGCGKIDPVIQEGSEIPEDLSNPKIPLIFNALADSTITKAVTNKAMGSAYDTNESFVAYAAYSEDPFTPTISGSYSNFWDQNGLTCTYTGSYNAWAPSTTYYWPKAGYLTFQAYSPAVAPGLTSTTHSWSDGFTFSNFTVQNAGSQYDLLYTERVENCQRSNYTISRSNGYDDDPNYPTFIYNGINLAFKHALNLIEVQAASALGSNATLKFYVQKIVLKNAYYKGTFTQNNESWDVVNSMVDYTVLDKGSDWQVLPGADESPASINPGLTLILMPQALHRSAGTTLDTATDAYLEVTYKEGSTGAATTIQIPLPDPWERGKKHTYRLVFSSHIEFTARITDWDDEIRGYHRIVI